MSTDTNRRSWHGRARWVPLAAVAAIAVAAGGVLVGRQMAGGAHSAPTSHAAAPAKTALGPREFIDMMIPHHEMAIEMANIAKREARDPNVRALASEIALFQTYEIKRMKQWRQQWFGTDSSSLTLSAADHAAMGMAADMGALRRSKNLDEAFLEAMIPHHAGALIMAQRALAYPQQRSEVSALARTTLDGQAQEVARMNEMRRNFATWGRAQP